MIIAASAIAAAVDHARASRPRECCGVLIGVGDEIREAIPGNNLAESPSRFLLDPKSHIDARRRARDRDLIVVGFYHSHPHSSACPSPTDLAEAVYGECVHLIVGFVAGEAEVRLFAYRSGRAIELEQAVAPS